MLGPIQSTYWWQDRIETSQEWLCLAKSKEEKFDEISRHVKRHHSYEVPEIIAVPLAASDETYAQWIEEEVNKPR
ncbi:MAG: divalent-cation tolerance protein CutA [bacterium]